MKTMVKISFVKFLTILGLMAALSTNTQATDCSRVSTPYAAAQCVEKDLNQADRAINSVYKKVMRSLPVTHNQMPSQTSLRKSQRAWLKFIEADCELTANGGGTWRAVSLMECRTDYLRSRTQFLRSLLN